MSTDKTIKTYGIDVTGVDTTYYVKGDKIQADNYRVVISKDTQLVAVFNNVNAVWVVSEPAPADVDPDEGHGFVVNVTGLYAQLDKAEADLASMTAERDEWKVKRNHTDSDLIDARRERDAQARDAIEWRNRYEALRADMETICADAEVHAKLVSGPSDHEDCAKRAHGQLVQILAHDDERAES